MHLAEESGSVYTFYIISRILLLTRRARIRLNFVRWLNPGSTASRLTLNFVPRLSAICVNYFTDFHTKYFRHFRARLSDERKSVMRHVYCLPELKITHLLFTEKIFNHYNDLLS